MKYFTPELIERTRSRDDRIANQAEDEWDEVHARYSDLLESVTRTMPRGLRGMVNRYYLHDAEVFRLGEQDRYFRIELQLDTPPRSFLTFRYRLLCPAQINREALPPECRAKSSRVDWLYAEIEQGTVEQILHSPRTATWVNEDWLTAAHASNGEGGEWPFWIHRILLSNGWEVTLHFHDVRIEEYEDLLHPVMSNSRTIEASAS